MTWIIISTGRSSLSSRVQLAGDWIRDIAQLLLLLLEIRGHGRGGVLLEPVGGFFDGLQELFRKSLARSE